jgi:hypothetical protein
MRTFKGTGDARVCWDKFYQVDDRDSSTKTKCDRPGIWKTSDSSTNFFTELDTDADAARSDLEGYSWSEELAYSAAKFVERL